ncbi:MAG: SpoIIE family protein phosphatase [Candidatus Eisenbacteria bacterium]
MQSEDILRQLIWRHDDLLRTLTTQLAGEAGECRVVDSAGQLVWSTQSEAARAQVVGGESSSCGEPSTRIAIGDHGAVELYGDASGAPELSALVTTLGELLASNLESESEFDRLVEDHVSNTNQLVALYNIITSTHETWELRDKLAVMVDEVGRQTAASVAILQVEWAGAEHFAWWPEDPSLEAPARELWEQCRTLGEPSFSGDPDGSAAAPIQVDDQVVGWLAVGRRGGRDGFTQRDLRLVEALAELTGGFLLNSRLQDTVVTSSKVQKELEIASQIQEMLMPRRLPRIEGVAVAAACQPASQVGGDFYVVQELPDGRSGFALGDVAGKGVPAALIMAMTRTVFRALGPHAMTSGQLLQQISDVIFDDLEEVRKFVTMVIGIYDPLARTVQLSNAGHSPVLYRPTPDEPLQMIEPVLPPLGVLRDLEDEVRELSFATGALLVMASDGITEARSIDGQMLGDERFVEIFHESRLAPEGLVREVLAETKRFARGAAQSDDQTLLVLEGS